MKKILENLALWLMIEYGGKKNIDVSGTHLVKNGRGFKWSLCNDINHRAVITICFHKTSVPTYYIHNN